MKNGVRYIVDVKVGQKTGFFLDQKYNRLAIQRICKDAKVLDCFTHTQATPASKRRHSRCFQRFGSRRFRTCYCPGQRKRPLNGLRALSLLSAEMYLIFFLNWNQRRTV